MPAEKMSLKLSESYYKSKYDLQGYVPEIECRF